MACIDVELKLRSALGVEARFPIVAFDERTLAFCEVKTRQSSGDRRRTFDALHPTKRSQVRKMAGRWLIERSDRPHADELRFDAIGVTFTPDGRLLAIEHLEGAF